MFRKKAHHGLPDLGKSITFAAKIRQAMMKYMYLGLLAILLASSCTDKKELTTKAPVRVKTEIVSAGVGMNGQTYVGIVEEREATAVSFTGMGVVKRMTVSEGQAVSRGQLIAEPICEAMLLIFIML
ncbi:MAG: efflux RND transporter periplasmic adaptor subunit [Erysipelotrichaceae bacterium]|nr:efflux RND transporter periplasmic adaptor subunit [Erysipelotrichaceae bacterium]